MTLLRLCISVLLLTVAGCGGFETALGDNLYLTKSGEIIGRQPGEAVLVDSVVYATVSRLVNGERYIVGYRIAYETYASGRKKLNQPPGGYFVVNKRTRMVSYNVSEFMAHRVLAAEGYEPASLDLVPQANLQVIRIGAAIMSLLRYLIG